MWLESEIEKLVKLITERMPSRVVTGTVASVDESNLTCKVTREDGPDFFNVRLNATIDSYNNRVAVIPEQGSKVTLLRLEDKTEAVIVKVSKIVKIEANINKTHFKTDEDGFVIERGGENLKSVLNSFIDEVAKIVVVQGTTVNVPALQQVKKRMNQILK